MEMSRTPRNTLLLDNAELLPRLVDLRNSLHRHPELGLFLPRTQAAVLAALAGLDLEITTGRTLSSVVAVLRGSQPGPAVLLRADMDALPVQEDSNEEFPSEVPGVMHACGHDLHTAGLVGAAHLLTARREVIPGSVVFMFQPGEEGPGGAQPMIEAGVLVAAGERVVAAYGLHVVSSMYRAGVATTRPGAILAAADEMTVTVVGRGGHGSMPHLAADPTTVLAETILALQSAVTRQFDVFDPVVVSIGTIRAGSVSNVIPDTATMQASIRTFTQHTHVRVQEVVTKLCQGIAAAHGLTAEVVYRTGYPVTVNDATEAARVARIASEMLGPDGYVPAPQPIPGSEDFSYVLAEVPGAFFGLGATPAELDPLTAEFNHSPKATFNTAALGVGPSLLAALTLDRLSVHEAPGSMSHPRAPGQG
jgi:amidohydrolase